MSRHNTKLLNLLLVIADAITLVIAFTVAYVIRVKYDPRPLRDSVHALDYVYSLLFIIPMWLIVFAVLGLYKTSILNQRLVMWAKLILGCFIGILLIIGWAYVANKPFFPARLVPVYALMISSVLLIVERELVNFIKKIFYKHGLGISRVLLVGSSKTTRDIAISLADTKTSGFQIVAILGPDEILPDDLAIIHYKTTKEALGNIARDRITSIIQTDLSENKARDKEIFEASEQNHLYYNFIPSQIEFYSGKNTIDVMLGYPMISVYQTPLVGWGAIVKRFFDIILSIIIIIILSPIYLLVTLLQLIFNPGPVFYISKRLSQFSEPINLIKYRSMDARYGSRDAALEFTDMGRYDLALEYEKTRKVKNDPRITWFGKFLRRTSLDELPQLFNVLKGDISLVGPRPILPQELKYVNNKRSLLHSVKSGLTGLWQVSGRSDLNFDKRIKLETFYAENWSVWLDIKILFKTVLVVIKGKGAE